MSGSPSGEQKPQFDLVVDGHRAQFVELSGEKAVVLSTMQLKPDQRVRVALRSSDEVVRTHARVESAKFEMPKEGARYRVVLQFEDAAVIAKLLGPSAQA